MNGFYVVGAIILLLTAIILLMGKITRMQEAARRAAEKAAAPGLEIVLNSLSHEFRTPLATIIGAADNLLEDRPELSVRDSKRLLASIGSASQRLNRQVENLLNLSRLEAGSIRPRKDWCDVQDLVSDTLRQLEELLAGHAVVTEIPEGFPLIKLDYGWMEQVLTNLICNACVHTAPDSLIRITATSPGESLVIVVEDNGDGIPKQEARKVFTKFYRPSGSRAGGSGMGLSIVKGFVEAHGGTISLERSSFGGARFTVRLPAEKLSIKQTAQWVLEKY